MKSSPATRRTSADVDGGDRRERLVERQDPVVERLLAADPRREVARLVHPQLEAAREVRLRLRQLLGRDGLVAQPGELGEDRVERRRQPLRVDAGRDLERAGVGVVDEPRRDVVGEALLLADRQEQPARHPVAEDRVEDREDPRVGVVAAEARDADDRAGPASRRAGRRAATRSPAGSAGAAAKPGTTPLPVPNASAARSTASSWSRSPATATTVFAGRYVVRQKSRIVSAGSARIPASSPQISRPSGPSPNIACWKRIWAYSAGSSRYERISSTITARSPSISVVVERRPDDQLAEDVHRPGRLAPRDADPVDGRLAVGRRVERAADALDRLGDRPGRGEARRPLERDVLHEVGDAGLARASRGASRRGRTPRWRPNARRGAWR